MRESEVEEFVAAKEKEVGDTAVKGNKHDIEKGGVKEIGIDGTGLKENGVEADGIDYSVVAEGNEDKRMALRKIQLRSNESRKKGLREGQ